MAKIFCQVNTITSGANAYPVYIGFMQAQDILEIATAPSFNDKTQNYEIAANAMHPPVKQWQRPLDIQRVDQISGLFNNTGEFMPNPVLLCENVTLHPSTITINQVMSGAAPTDLYEVDIPYVLAGQEKPLWILDGQHRINGMGKSKQKNNLIPVVMLLNHQGNHYSGSTLAKIFAQVTTTATKLDELHNEWLTFAFNLDAYDKSRADWEEHKNAMECVATLCNDSMLGSTTLNNAFHSKVQFSHYMPGGPTLGGFTYTCKELKKMVWEHYFHNSSPVGHLDPDDLAEQMGLAYLALAAVIPASQMSKSVFFGGSPDGQKIMQDAYIIGVLTYLLYHGVPASWTDVLKKLLFDKTNWNFSWVKTLNGTSNTRSKTLATNVFADAFRQDKLPTGSSDLADYLRGNNSSIALEFFELSPNGRPRPTTKVSKQLTRGGATSHNASTTKYLKLGTQTANIAHITVVDNQSTPGRVVYYDTDVKRGMLLDNSRYSNPLKLQFVLESYGGNTATIDIDISF